jgi:LacI family transcriptional regulator
MTAPPRRRVGVLINLAGPYGRFVLEGILRYAQGGWMIFTRPMPALSRSILFENWDIDGLIAQLPVREHQERLAKRTRVPVVNVTTTLPAAAVPTVTSDHEALVRIALDDFESRGLRNVAYAGASQAPLAAYSRIRGESFAQLATEREMACFRHDVEPGTENAVEHGPRQALVNWLLDLPKPVGILAASDESAWDVLQACAIAGMSVPDEVAVMGIDNDDLIVRLTTPPLSSIDINAERVGFEAAKLLDSLLSGQPAPSEPVLVPPLGLVTRQSTDVLAIEDEDVAEAVKFIREHRARPITVKDVLERVPVSRRSLYRKFRDAMGRSLAAEIRLAHINQAKRLLATTDWAVSRVAEASGFLGATRFGIVFRRATGLTPTQYREERVVKSTGPQDAKPVAARSSTLEPAVRKRPQRRNGVRATAVAAARKR